MPRHISPIQVTTSFASLARELVSKPASLRILTEALTARPPTAAECMYTPVRTVPLPIPKEVTTTTRQLSLQTHGYPSATAQATRRVRLSLLIAWKLVRRFTRTKLSSFTLTVVAALLAVYLRIVRQQTRALSSGFLKVTLFMGTSLEAAATCV